MTGWNLPPGCTDRDIEIDQGTIVFCTLCGKDLDPEDFEDDEPFICGQCQSQIDNYNQFEDE